MRPGDIKAGKKYRGRDGKLRYVDSIEGAYRGRGADVFYLQMEPRANRLCLLGTFADWAREEVSGE